VLCTAVPRTSAGLGHEFLPPEHWGYPVLERFEALGFCALPSERPLSRDEVIGLVNGILRHAEGPGVGLSGRDRFNLARLEQEFVTPEAGTNPKARYDPPLFYTPDGPFHLEGDLDLGFSAQQPIFDGRWAFFGIGRPSLKLHFQDRATYEVRYRLVMGPERGLRRRHLKPSPREKSWRGLTALYERSYLVFQWKQAALFLGRDVAGWGPSSDGNLIVSQSADGLDKVGVRLKFKNFRLSSFHAVLSAGAKRYLSAHRLELATGRFTLGVSETVLYLDRGIDPVYVLPLSSFYSNQFNERADDNVLWSFDLKYIVPYGFLLYGSFLIDDFQFDRDGQGPDNIAFDIGARAAITRPVAITVRLHYRYVDTYTYTHRDTVKSYVAGNGDPGMGDPPLGAAEGPDSDVIRISADVFPTADVTATISASLLRRGEANGFESFVEGEDASPPFPSGVVEKTLDLGTRLRWELAHNSSLNVDFLRSFVMNKDHRSGDDEWDTSIRFDLIWDL
jgi:hypothetical protein